LTPSSDPRYRLQTRVTEWTLLGISGASSGTAAYMLGGEVLASRGIFQLSNSVARQVGVDGERYWSETLARDYFTNGTRVLNTGGQNGLYDTLTTIKYELPGNGSIVRNWLTNNITHYLPYGP